MNKTKSILMGLLVAGVALISFGCAGNVNVPKTALSIKTPSYSVNLDSEKDTDLQDFKVTRDDAGNVVVSLDRFTATNSPAVIRETGKAQALTIKANGDLVNAAGNIVGKVVEGVVTIYGSP